MITTKTLANISKALGYINAMLFLIMLTPLICGIGEVEIENSTFVFAIKCMIIIIPVIATEMAERLSKNLAIYLLVCIGLFAFIFAVAYVPFCPLSIYDVCYLTVIVGETILLIITRLIDRLKKVDDFLSAKEPSIFDRPKVIYAWYFILMYIVGILFNSKMLCDISFWVTIIYMLAAFVFEYLAGTKKYLYLNNRTKGIPRKRLYGISTAMVLIFLLICLMGSLPSMFMSGYRRYTDVRHWFEDMPPVVVEYEGGGDFEPSADMDSQLSILLEQDGEPAKPSKLLNAIFWILGAICFIVIIYGLVQFIRQIFKDFRNTLDENGDIIEEIKDDEAGYKESELYLKGKHLDSEAMRVRRRYKKTIKKHRKDLPAPYESPDEIEMNAGLAGSEDMKQLHGEYENARYGKI
jgi:hypothetical protein